MGFGISPNDFDISNAIFEKMVQTKGSHGGDYSYVPIKYLYGNNKPYGLHVTPSPKENVVRCFPPKDMNGKPAIMFIFDDYKNDNLGVLAIQLLITYQCRKQMKNDSDTIVKHYSNRVYPKFFIKNMDELEYIDISTIDNDYTNSDADRETFMKTEGKKYSVAQHRAIVNKMYAYLDDKGATVDNAIEAIKTYAPHGIILIANCKSFNYADRKTGKMNTISFTAVGKAGQYTPEMLNNNIIHCWPRIKYDRITLDNQTKILKPSVSCHYLIVKQRELIEDNAEEYFNEVPDEEYESSLRQQPQTSGIDTLSSATTSMINDDSMPNYNTTSTLSSTAEAPTFG